jgi:GST-like protein
VSGRVLYGMGSPNVRKVGILLEELGLDYRLEHVAVFGGEQFTSAFQALNPLGKVPVLVDPANTAPLFESGAILFYLAEIHGAFLPAAGSARYEVMQWLMVQMAAIGPMFGQHTHFLSAQADRTSYAAIRYRAQAEKLYAQVDERLADREWIAGDAYSIADIAIYPWMLYLERHGFDPAAHPAMLRWRSMIDARPAVIRTAERFAAAFDDISTRTRRAATPSDLHRLFAWPSDAPAADFSAITQR